MELEAIQGASDLFNKHDVPYVLMNWDTAKFKERGVKAEDIVDLMEKYGYKMSLDRFDGPVVKNYEEVEAKS